MSGRPRNTGATWCPSMSGGCSPSSAGRPKREHDMKMHQEFTVTEPVSAVWKFFEEPESVARCLPGVEQVTVLDEDNVQVRATQSLGPMTATFEAKGTVLVRGNDGLIRFRAAGKSVRGAIGNLRTENTVRLRDTADGTSVL